MSKRALLIGNNLCPAVGNLSYADNDAEAVADSLQRNYGFNRGEIVLMTSSSEGNRFPLCRNIRKQLDSLCELQERLDFLAIGFWGHGFRLNDGNRYLCGPETDCDDLQRTTLLLNFVLGCVGQIGAATTVLFLDCCQNVPEHYGLANNNRFSEFEEDALRDRVEQAARDVVLTRQKKRWKAVEPTVAILNACSAGERAYVWEEQTHGVFTHFLLEAFERRERSANSCFEYVSRQMQSVEYHNCCWCDRQRPSFTTDGVAYLPAGLDERAHAPNVEKTDSAEQTEEYAQIAAGKAAAEEAARKLAEGSRAAADAQKLAAAGDYWQAVQRIDAALGFFHSGELYDAWSGVRALYERSAKDKDEKEKAEKDREKRVRAVEQGNELIAKARTYAEQGNYSDAVKFADDALILGPTGNTLDAWRQLRDSWADADGWGDTNVRAAGTAKTLKVKGVEYRLRWATAGTFMMGSSESERKLVAEEYRKACDGKFSFVMDDEILHEVKLSRGFWMMETEVTQRMYTSLIGKNPSWYCKDGNGAEQVKGRSTDEFPVECVSWDDCQEFVKKLNAKVSKIDPTLRFRLPTEAEWEYACRGGEDYRYSGSDNLDEVGWYDPKFFEHCEWDEEEKIWRFKDDYVTPGPHKVGGKKPNAWGLYDMSGNVWEWVQDWYSANAYSEGRTTDPQGPDSGLSRVYRGGGWSDNFAYCRRAYRDCLSPARRDGNLGFRLVLESSKEKEE